MHCNAVMMMTIFMASNAIMMMLIILILNTLQLFSYNLYTHLKISPKPDDNYEKPSDDNHDEQS